MRPYSPQESETVTGRCCRPFPPQAVADAYQFSACFSAQCDKAAVVTLSDGKLQTADGGNGGVGAQQTLPQAGAFSDEALIAGETLDVPFMICLKNLNSFSLLRQSLGAVGAMALS
jgi:hypothetical protein